MTAIMRDTTLNLRVLIDDSIVEVFAEDGERVLTDLVNPAVGSNGLKLSADRGTAALEVLAVHQMRSIWPGRQYSTAPAAMGYRKMRCANRYRSFLQTAMCAHRNRRARRAARSFLQIHMRALTDEEEAVLSPQETQRSFNWSRAFAGSETSCSGIFVFGAEEKPPTQANGSRFVRPKFSDCPPPIDRPAMARLSRSVLTEYLASMNGIRSSSRSRSNCANASDDLASHAGGRYRSACARPFGMTTIIGTAFLSAIRLSRIAWGIGAALPLRLIAADAMQQVKHGVSVTARVPRRAVNENLASVSDCLRVVLDRVCAAARNPFARRVEALGCRRREGLVVRAEDDGLTATAASLPGCGSGNVRSAVKQAVNIRRSASGRGAGANHLCIGAVQSAKSYQRHHHHNGPHDFSSLVFSQPSLRLRYLVVPLQPANPHVAEVHSVAVLL